MTEATVAPSVRPAMVSVLAEYGPEPCIFFEDTVLSYDDVRGSILRYARALLAQGIKAGDGLALLTGNRPEQFYTTSAAQLLGVRTLGLHPLTSAKDHAYVLGDAEIDRVVFDPRYAELMGKLSELRSLKTIASFGPSGNAFDLVHAASQESSEPLDASLLGTPPSVIVYTGGTTGRPKGIMMAPEAGAFAMQAIMTQWQWPQDIRMLLSTPLNHAAGTMLLPTFLRGGSIVLVPNFSPERWLEAVEKYRVTAAMIVPTQLYRILDSLQVHQSDLSSLESIFYGAAPCSPTRLAEAIGIFGQVFFQFYGQTEAPMTVCVMRKEDHDPANLGRLTSCGKPIAGIDVRLLDEDGREVAEGEPGEICVSGPLVSLQGYKNRPEETAEALAGGWLHTGDIAKRDEEGFLYIVDRRKDMIVSGGYNIYPREIEDVLAAHPGVSQVAVIGIPDPRWGESLKAVVVRRAGADDLTADELIQFVKDEKGAHYAPKSVDFVDTVPLSPLGKLDKKALRSQYWGEEGRLVH
jgi:fatty-acyl-CoA synthase